MTDDRKFKLKIVGKLTFEPRFNNWPNKNWDKVISWKHVKCSTSIPEYPQISIWKHLHLVQAEPNLQSLEVCILPIMHIF